MPEMHPSHMRPGKVRTLGDCAQANQLIMIRCLGCFKTNYYLATDLVLLVDPYWPAWIPPFPCGKCKTDEFMNVELRTPYSGDYGNLKVRRPAGVVKTQKWKTVLLGD